MLWRCWFDVQAALGMILSACDVVLQHLKHEVFGGHGAMNRVT
jgi:hypothetical protein